MVCTKLGKNWSSGSGEEEENVKSFNNDDADDDNDNDGQIVIRKAHLSLPLRKAKKIYIHVYLKMINME